MTERFIVVIASAILILPLRLIPSSAWAESATPSPESPIADHAPQSETSSEDAPIEAKDGDSVPPGEPARKPAENGHRLIEKKGELDIYLPNRAVLAPRKKVMPWFLLNVKYSFVFLGPGVKDLEKNSFDIPYQLGFRVGASLIFFGEGLGLEVYPFFVYQAAEADEEVYKEVYGPGGYVGFTYRWVRGWTVPYIGGGVIGSFLYGDIITEGSELGGRLPAGAAYYPDRKYPIAINAEIAFIAERVKVKDREKKLVGMRRHTNHFALGMDITFGIQFP